LYSIGCEDGLSFVPAEMMFVAHSNVEVNFFLDKVSDAVKKINPYIGKAVANYVVVDNSWSLILGVCKGINNEQIPDYYCRSFYLMKNQCE